MLSPRVGNRGWTLVIGGNVGAKQRIARELFSDLSDNEALSAHTPGGIFFDLTRKTRGSICRFNPILLAYFGVFDNPFFHCPERGLIPALLPSLHYAGRISRSDK